MGGRTLSIGAAVLAVGAGVLIPLLPGPVQVADPSNACVDTGQVDATIYDITDHVHPWFLAQPVCPLGFAGMHILFILSDETSPPPQSPICVRNVQRIECEASSPTASHRRGARAA